MIADAANWNKHDNYDKCRACHLAQHEVCINPSLVEQDKVRRMRPPSLSWEEVPEDGTKDGEARQLVK